MGSSTEEATGLSRSKSGAGPKHQVTKGDNDPAILRRKVRLRSLSSPVLTLSSLAWKPVMSHSPYPRGIFTFLSAPCSVPRVPLAAFQQSTSLKLADVGIRCATTGRTCSLRSSTLIRTGMVSSHRSSSDGSSSAGECTSDLPWSVLCLLGPCV